MKNPNGNDTMVIGVNVEMLAVRGYGDAWNCSPSSSPFTSGRSEPRKPGSRWETRCWR